MKSNSKNYHGELATFEIGQNVQHVTDQGEIANATITGISDNLLHLSFQDGEEGSESPETCF